MTHLKPLIVSLVLFCSVPVLAANCSEVCTDSTDCTGACRTCISGFCESCCETLAEDQGACENNFDGCTWNAGLGVCEDIPTQGCNNGIPEAPQAEKSKGAWMVLAVGVSALAGYLAKKKFKKSV